MGHRKPTYKQTAEAFQIHTKTGKEKFLCEVAGWYERLYPERSDYFKRALRQLKEVTTPTFQAGAAGEMRVTMRVPAELLLFVQRWIPGFGNESEDIELMTKVWCDLVRPTRDHRRRTRLTVRF